MSYIYIWRVPRLYGIYMWRPARELISGLEIRPDRVAYIHLYEGGEEHIKLACLGWRRSGIIRLRGENSII